MFDNIPMCRFCWTIWNGICLSCSPPQPTPCSVPQASPAPVRNRFGVLDEDTVFRPSRHLVLAPMTRSWTGEEDCSANVEQAGLDQFDMILADTDGEFHQYEDGQATTERVPPGILDQGRVAVFVEEWQTCPIPVRRRHITSR